VVINTGEADALIAGKRIKRKMKNEPGICKRRR